MCIRDRVYLDIAGDSVGRLYSKEYVSIDGIIAAIIAKWNQTITGKLLTHARQRLGL